MEKAYRNVSLFFAAILLLVFAGFYKTYFGLFPSFAHVTSIQHIHGSLFLLWFIMLVVQPLLIRKRMYAWHRLIGKASYVLVPLIVVSIYFIARELYQAAPPAMTEQDRIANLFTPFYQIVDFVSLYALAIYYRKKISYHMRYMIATSLAIYGAATRRFFIHLVGLSSQQAALYTFLLTGMILLGLIAYDARHGKSFRPYVVALAIVTLSALGFYFFRYGQLWQGFGARIAHLF